MNNIIPASIITVIWLGSFVISSTPYLLVDSSSKIVNLSLIALGLLLFVFTSTIIAGVVSLIGKSGIKRGKFPRDLDHPVYFKRRIYGICWTQLFYFKPIYSVVISIPILKKIVFRLFGYKGSMDITIYPDTWIRDLPLLKFSPKTYLSNRATIGSNICLNDGTILVDGITTGNSAMIGHLAMVAPGCKIAAKSEVGVGTALGIRVRMGTSSIIKPTCAINHGVVIGDNCDIGSHTYLGLKTIIGNNVVLPPGSNIPNGSTIMNQEEANNYYSSETLKLEKQKDTMAQLLIKTLNHGS
ncbi:MAG: hypothetical protein V4596_06780 [Bdellovibrionota bacterium]